MGLGKIFKSIGSFCKGLFSKWNREKVSSALNKLGYLAEVALPIVEMVVKATPTSADDLLLEAAKNIGVSINEIFSNTNELIKDGGRQRLAAEALKLKLLQLIQKGSSIGEDKFLGEFALDSVADVLNLDKTTLLTAVQSAVYLKKQLG